MGFDKFKNFWNVDIKDGVEGKAYVQSASHPPDDATATNVVMWLDVYVEGWEPYRVEHNCFVKISKHPQPGETLPVIVDRKNKERIDIQWDQVKTVDEIMREGSPAGLPGQPQVINLSGAGLSGDLNQQIQQAMEMAQQAMQQAHGEAIAPGEPRPAPATADAAPATADASPNMVEVRLAQLERLAALRDAGALSDAEYEAEKVKVLSGG
jgi:Short C-terminal domain